MLYSYRHVDVYVASINPEDDTSRNDPKCLKINFETHVSRETSGISIKMSLICSFIYYLWRFDFIPYALIMLCKEFMMSNVELSGYVPGAIGRVAELRATYYHRNWDFGLFFEAKVATELSKFLNRFDETRDGFWTVCLNNRVEGSITIDGVHASTEGAHLRWFILSSESRGRGHGNRLMKEAISFCKKNIGYKKIRPSNIICC